MSPDPALDAAAVAALASLVAARLPSRPASPLVLGLCGAQGSGKSTLATGLAALFAARGTPTAVLSLDDLYKTAVEREALARRVHPLLRTRGVPGTHDVALGLETLNGIREGREPPLPRFDKARDDRRPSSAWARTPPGARLVIFEGWCVGARPQLEAELAEPVNALERSADCDGRWRRYVNDRLADDYQALFSRIDVLALLAAPDFDAVFAWRAEQERRLRAEQGFGMADEEVSRFVRHYERLTRHILREMPGRADLVLRLDSDRRLVAADGAG